MFRNSEYQFFGSIVESGEKVRNLISSYCYLGGGETKSSFTMNGQMERFLVRSDSSYFMLTMLEMKGREKEGSLFALRRIRYEKERAVPYGEFVRIFRDEKFWKELHDALNRQGVAPFSMKITLHDEN